MILHGCDTPSAWVRRWSHLLPSLRSSVLDVACGHGRHMRWFAEKGHEVTGIDRSPQAITASARWGSAIEADIENGPWPLEGATFDAVVVTNYLWRPLMPRIVASVAPGGVLIYETFASGNETVGKPSRPDFLLQPGELLRATSELQTVAYENGFLPAPDRFVQRVVAIRKPGTSAVPPLRHRLEATE